LTVRFPRRRRGRGEKQLVSASTEKESPQKLFPYLKKFFADAILKTFQFLRALSAVRRRAAGQDCRPNGGNYSGFSRK